MKRSRVRFSQAAPTKHQVKATFSKLEKVALLVSVRSQLSIVSLPPVSVLILASIEAATASRLFGNKSA